MWLRTTNHPTNLRHYAATTLSATHLDPPRHHTREQIGADVASGLADLEAYGQMVLANPDFVARLMANGPMNDAGPQHLLWR